jgi:hypothetical protein
MSWTHHRGDPGRHVAHGGRGKLAGSLVALLVIGINNG